MGKDKTMSEEQIKDKCYSVLYYIETGKSDPNYGALVIMHDGKDKTPQITYGKLQVTEQGSLKALIEMYDGEFKDEFLPFMDLIGIKPLYRNDNFIKLLKQASKDERMKQAQDSFFDQRYWLKSNIWRVSNGFHLPLSSLVIFDSFIQSGGIKTSLRNLFSEYPPAQGGDEKNWIKQYVEVRHNWLTNHSTPELRRSNYRTSILYKQIKDNNWDLNKTIYDCRFAKKII